MIQVLLVLFCLGLFAASLSLFSKSAEQRARARTEYFYASQIREEVEAIRLQNELKKNELKELEKITSKFEATNTDKSNKKDLLVFSTADESNQEVLKFPIKEVELKELELDEKALEFVSKFQPKQEEILLPDVTAYEEPTAWFSFPEVDLHMNERPMKGLYYVAGKVLDVLDEMSAIISDGTGERMVYHQKVQKLSVGDIVISQVNIQKGIWNFINLWEINDSVNQDREAM